VREVIYKLLHVFRKLRVDNDTVDYGRVTKGKEWENGQTRNEKNAQIIILSIIHDFSNTDE